MSPNHLDAEAAQLWAVNAFRNYFLRKFPTGIVISELEYMGRTTRPSGSPTPLRIPGKPTINKILDALAHDFRRGVKNGDYRKCDILGISNDGLNAELVEVTTADNVSSASTQISAKLATLHQLVNRIHHLNVNWRASAWRPALNEMYRKLEDTPVHTRYICYQPTIRRNAPAGVILYEIHLNLRNPAPVPAPQFAKDKIREALPQTNNVEEKARIFIREHPEIASWIRALALGLAAAAVVAAIVALIDPVPGDEVVAALFARALFRIATG